MPTSSFEQDRQAVLVQSEEQESLTLEDCFRLALLYSENLALRGEDYFQAVLMQHKTQAQLLPTLTFRGTWDRQDAVPTSGGSTSSSREQQQSYFRLEQTLFEGFKNLSNYKRAGFQAKSLEHLIRRERDLILLSVAEAFYLTLQHQQAVLSRQKSLQVQESRLSRIEAEYEAGVARSTDVLLTRASLEKDRADLAAAQQNFQSARNLLSLRMGVWSEQPLNDEFRVPSQALPSVEVLIQKAMATRADLQAASAELQARRMALQSALGEWAPAFRFEGNAWTQREGVNQDSDWDVRITGVLPLFDGGLRRAGYREAQSRRRQAELQVSRLEKQIHFEVEDLKGKLMNQEVVLEAAETQLRSASEAFSQVWAEYLEGEATNLEIITAQNLLLAAEITLTQEQLNKKILWLQLLVAIGQTPIMEQQL